MESGGDGGGGGGGSGGSGVSQSRSGSPCPSVACQNIPPSNLSFKKIKYGR